MKHLGLFEGIGGFSLAARWAGWETIAWCEWNEFGQRVLRHHFPKAEGFGDITKTDFTKFNGTVEIITGGFPCQPYSMAGKRLGKEDDRHLWPEMLRAIREVQPTGVVGENVLGLVNWSGGLVFHEVQADLEAQGYEVQPYVLPACAVNAPHRRDRVWFVAYNNSFIRGEGRDAKPGKQPRHRKSILSTSTERTTPHPDSNGLNRSDSEHEEQSSEGGQYAQRDVEQMGESDTANTGNAGLQEWQYYGERENQTQTRTRLDDRTKRPCNDGIIANTNSTSSQCRNSQAEEQWEKQSRRIESFSEHTGWEIFPTQSPICGGDDGLPTGLDGITFSKWRAESIKAYGNAIVPAVALMIFKSINQYNSLP